MFPDESVKVARIEYTPATEIPLESGILTVIVDAPSVIVPPADVSVSDSVPPTRARLNEAVTTLAITNPVPGVSVIATSVFIYKFVTQIPRCLLPPNQSLWYAHCTKPLYP